MPAAAATAEDVPADEASAAPSNSPAQQAEGGPTAQDAGLSSLTMHHALRCLSKYFLGVCASLHVDVTSCRMDWHDMCCFAESGRPACAALHGK